LPLFDLVEHVPRDAPGPAPAAAISLSFINERERMVFNGIRYGRCFAVVERLGRASDDEHVNGLKGKLVKSTDFNQPIRDESVQ
jgi:hypothetical protein